MDHTHIVNSSDLERYANTRDSQAVVPELLYFLVRQSVPPSSLCRIPYGDAVNQPGCDGLVETQQAFLEFVPEGMSYWELGTGSDPQKKATKDFRKRTKALTSDELSRRIFVFVTPRSGGSGGWTAQKQTAWLRRRRESGWKQIRIIDGIILADWLREFPSIGRWLAKKMGLSKSLGGFTTPREHWELIAKQVPTGNPPLPPELFTAGRANICVALQELFDGSAKTLMIFAESNQDVADFVAAYIASLDDNVGRHCVNRCLYVQDEDAWRSVIETRNTHVLVADPRLGLEIEENTSLLAMAGQRGHAVVLPLHGAYAGAAPSIMRLRSPSASQIETCLRTAGYSDLKSRELARIGGDRISALRRKLQGLEAVPPYGTWGNARLLALAGLAGMWDGSSAEDKAALERLVGKAYGEWIEPLRADALRSDSPLIQNNEKWRFVSRGEAWDVLGCRLADDDLDRFAETVVQVLGERDPQFDLPHEQRYAASIHEKQLRHSSHLRKGLAETLAIMGSRPEALSSCTLHKPETVALLAVRRLLANANWERWASLDPLLPLLAEAAPDEFLDAVESALKDLHQSPFHGVFEQERGGVIAGHTYMSGLLWALEGLAWNAGLLARVSLIFADLASIDPGGTWANRPFNSLVHVFLPWYVQTCAPIDKRNAAVTTVIRQSPDVGWRLILSLLPHGQGSTTGCHQPTWRNYIPDDWKSGVLQSEYLEQITAYTDLAIGIALQSTEKTTELIKRLSDLPRPAREGLLGHLSSDAITELPEAERHPIWEQLCALVRQHRRFADADWVLPDEAVVAIEKAASALEPDSMELKYYHLFSKNDFDLFEEKGNYAEQRKQLGEIKRRAVRAILDDIGIAATLRFARRVRAPREVGFALGKAAGIEVESAILPSLLDTHDEAEQQIVSGFVWARFSEAGWAWVDSLLANDWGGTLKAALLVLLPCESETWGRVGDHLSEQDEHLYWEKATVNPYKCGSHLKFVTQKLIQYGRAPTAVHCLAGSIEEGLDPELAIQVLHAALQSTDDKERIEQRWVVDVITHLQTSARVDSEELYALEWSFLPLLDEFSSGSPLTLGRRLASDPAFFAEIIALAYRPDNEAPREEERTPQQKRLAQNALMLLNEWHTCPGCLADGKFNGEVLKDWVRRALSGTEATGHVEIARLHIGQVLVDAPGDPDGLWVHQSVASILDEKDAGEMRSGYTTEHYNRRGVHGFSAGEEERSFARRYRERADTLESHGFVRFAAAVRALAANYEREAQRESQRRPYDD